MRVTISAAELAAYQEMANELRAVCSTLDEVTELTATLEQDHLELRRDADILAAAITKLPKFYSWLLEQDNSSSEMFGVSPGNAKQNGVEGKTDFELALAWAVEQMEKTNGK